MAPAFCNVTWSWVPKCDIQHLNVTSYSFIDISSCAYEDISFDDRKNCLEDISVQFCRKDEENFALSIECVNPELIQINGISIDSESRTLEISNEVEGYIKTIRGQKLPLDSSTQPCLYVCSGSFEKAYTSLSVKFLSLGDKDSINVRSIKINVLQLSPDSSDTRHSNSAFDVTKLKKEVEGMGDAVSHRALDFLKTMEIFEQNKIKTMGSLIGQNSLASKPVLPGLGLASNSNGNGLGLGIASVMRSVLGDKTMSHLQQDMSNGEEDLRHEGDDIYSMLQTVCGKVAKTRQSTHCIKESQTKEEQEDEKTLESDENGIPRMNNSVLEILNHKLEEAKREMKDEVASAKQEVMSQMEGMNKELTEKLDKISLLLERLTNSQPSLENGVE